MSARQGQKKEKSYCENTKKPATSFPSFDPNLVYYIIIVDFSLFVNITRSVRSVVKHSTREREARVRRKRRMEMTTTPTRFGIFIYHFQQRSCSLINLNICFVDQCYQLKRRYTNMTRKYFHLNSICCWLSSFDIRTF